MTIRQSDWSSLSRSLSLFVSPFLPLSLPSLTPTLLPLLFSPLPSKPTFLTVAPSNPLRSRCCSLKSAADLLFTIIAIIYCSCISSRTKRNRVVYRGEIIAETEEGKEVKERGGVKDVSRERWQAERNTISHSLMWKLWFLPVCVCVWAHTHASVSGVQIWAYFLHR